MSSELKNRHTLVRRCWYVHTGDLTGLRITRSSTLKYIIKHSNILENRPLAPGTPDSDGDLVRVCERVCEGIL